MNIGAVPDPEGWERWEEARALLEPARELFGDDTPAMGFNEALFVVMDGDELLACATAWLSTLGFCEIKCVAGRDYLRWVKELDEVIGSAARAAGAVEMRGHGRRGWAKALRKLGWDSFRIDGETNGYLRSLVV